MLCPTTCPFLKPGERRSLFVETQQGWCERYQARLDRSDFGGFTFSIVDRYTSCTACDANDLPVRDGSYCAPSCPFIRTEVDGYGEPYCVKYALKLWLFTLVDSPQHHIDFTGDRVYRKFSLCPTCRLAGSPLEVPETTSIVNGAAYALEADCKLGDEPATVAVLSLDIDEQ